MRKCRYCKVELPKAKNSKPIERHGFCSYEHMAQYGHEKAVELQEKAKRKEVRQAKERIKTLQQHVSDTQAWVNRVVVAQDKGRGCISCELGEVTDAGHYFHKGSKYRTSPLTLDRRNLTGQCRACNGYKGGGNQHEYRLGYIARYGQEAFDELCEYKESVDRGEVPRLTVDECKAIAKQAREELKRIRL